MSSVTDVVRAADAAAGESRRRPLPYWPAIDGLRGLAVAAVLLYHHGYSRASGGFLGVSLFFTLSGFLIISLVVAEHGRSGEVRLTAFWARRIRRLLPAALLGLVLALVVTATVVGASQRAEALGDIRAALFNLANWRFIWQEAPYADVGLMPSPVQHYWSLAIEEQFYLLFPLVAAAALWARRRVGLAAVLLVLTAVSVWRQWTVLDHDRIYFGTDTRMAELTVGGLLALARVHLVRVWPTRKRGLADLAGFGALLVTAVLWINVSLANPFLYAGGFLMIALVSAALVYASVEGRRLPAVLSARPLVALGKISYGVYIFHFPVFLALTEDRISVGGHTLFAARVAVTLAISVASYHLIEYPIRSGRAIERRRAPALALGGLGAVVVLSLVVGLRPQTSDVETAAIVNGVAVVPSAPVTQPSVVETTAPPTTEATAPPSTDTAATTPPAPTTTTAPPLAPARAPRVVVVGDSTAAANGSGLRAWGIDSGKLSVTTVSSPGCATYSGERFLVRPGYEFVPKGCDSLFSVAADTARDVDADAIVVFIGTSQLADWKYSELDGWHALTETGIQSRYRSALDAAVAELAGAGVPILWADTPTPDWDLEAFGGLVGSDLPGSGAITLNDAARAALLNQLTRDRTSGQPLVSFWPYTAELDEPDGRIPDSVRPDGLHVSEEAIAQLADRSLYSTMETAYRSVVATGPSGLQPPDDHAWSR